MTQEPQLTWEVGTGYDLFISLDVLHNPDRYGLRGSWAAGVRSRLPVEQRDLLQVFLKHSMVWVIPWIVSLSEPKNSVDVLESLSEIPAAKRLSTLMAYTKWNNSIRDFLTTISDKGVWTEEDVGTLRTLINDALSKEGSKKKKLSDKELGETLAIWAEAERHGHGFLESLRTYHEVFFAEEEKRIKPALEKTVAHAQQLQKEMPLEALLNELSQGLRFEFDGTENMKELLMVPSFWTTPLSLFSAIDEKHESWVFLFGGRPASQSLVPGEVVPELLYQTLKALADPTRLRILRYLSEEPLTPAELARRLRLRPPTVIHHLDTLRLARLVHVSLSHQGRRYEARREAIETAYELLRQFLNGRNISPK